MMSRDEIHEPEVEHLHAGQARDLVRLAERAVRLDQSVDRDLAADVMARRDLLDVMIISATCAAAVGFGMVM